MTLSTSPYFKFGVSVRAGGSSLPANRINSIQITRTRNQPLTWSITSTKDQSKLLDPFNSSGTYYTDLQTDVFSSDFTIDRSWGIGISIGGQVWNSPELVLIETERDSSADSYRTVFSGIDFSRLLQVENQSMDSWVSTATKVYYAKEIIQTILSNFGVTSYELNFTDYPVREFHFQQQSPLSVIEDLLEVVKAEWFFRGRTFVARTPNYQSVNWTYPAGSFFRFTRKKSTAAMINEVIVCRTESAPEYEEFEQNGESACGLISLNFSGEKVNPQIHVIQSRFCVIENISFRDKNGVLNSESGYTGLASGCQFVARPIIIGGRNVPGITGTCYWKVRVTGASGGLYGLISNFDDKFSVTVKDADSIEEYGKQTAPNPIDNTLIPNEEIARLHGQKYLAEQRRLLETVSFEVRLNPWIEPGQNVNVSDYGTSTSSRTYFVESVSHNISGFVGKTSVTASRYLSD